MSNRIPIKTAKEIEIMRQGGKILSQIAHEIKNEVRSGVSTAAIENSAKKLFAKHNVKPSFLGFHDYPATICVSINEELVHGIPGRRIIKEGDIVSVDIGVLFQGFHTDIAFTKIIGKGSPKDTRLVRATREALDKGVRQARVGKRLGDISAAVQKVIEKSGFSIIRDCTGHGIGKTLHENPSLPNFGRVGTGPSLTAGMVLAIEPMASEGTYELDTLSDGWTLFTHDKSNTAHFEVTVAITREGPEVLTPL